MDHMKAKEKIEEGG